MFEECIIRSKLCSKSALYQMLLQEKDVKDVKILRFKELDKQ